MAKIALSLLGALLLGCLAYGSKCPEQDSITRHVLCYYEGRTPLDNINLCNCTHIVLTNAVRVTANYTLDLIEDARKDLDKMKDRKPSLTRVFTLNGNGKFDSNALESGEKSRQLADGIADFVRNSDFNGVEVSLPLTVRDDVGKDSVTAFVKLLKKTLENMSHLRVKRAGYYVSENLEDDITTAPYRTPTARSVRSNEKFETNKKTSGKRRGKNYRGAARYSRKEQEEEVESRTEKRSRRMRKELRGRNEPGTLLLVRIPTNPEVIAKKFDLKALSKYADLLVVPTHNITDETEAKYTYHPSRLMGLSDMLNADSILDFLTGLGVTKSKIVLTIPATILKFKLEDPKKTTPRSVRVGQPEVIDQSQLCSFFSKGNWTVERDDDLTAPYAFSGKTWLAYEDRISVNIKAKYILLRELAGGAVYPIDADTGRDPCNDTSAGVGFLTNTLYKNVMSLERKPRGLVLESLQQDIHDTAYSTVEAGVHLSEYRIVRVVDHSGAVHVIRKNTKTQFECSRQGYFSHPLGCNKFYRCVKFNQYTDDFTVFEYDCPAGLAFDERWEVCVWPGSLPHGAPCTGSSEIAPVPRSHYQCPNQEGYYADLENCRWFFACLDHARDGVTPLTAYEFRCPFGLVFNEQKLVCDWPWNVGVCGNRGFSGVIVEHHGGSSSSLQSATYVNTGAYESGYSAADGSGFAHSGQYNQQGSFGASAGSAHSGSGQSGSGYIAGHFEDNQDRASFGTVPEFEISGGRILNRGGLVLNQNINLHGAADVSNVNSGSYVSGAHDAGYVSVSTASPVVHTVQTVKPSPGLSKLNLVYNPPLSSPRPFAVNVPEVQVNQEQHSVDVAYVGGSTTSSPETVAYVSGAKSGSSDSVNTFTVSSESGEYVRDDTGFGDKVGIAVGQGFKSVGVQVTTPSPNHLEEVQVVTTGYDSGSGTIAGYDSGAVTVGKTISVSPEVYQANGYYSAGGSSNAAAYGVVSTTPSPEVYVHNAGVSETTVLVTPKSIAQLQSYHQSEDLRKASGLSAVNVASVGLFTASNGSDSFAHRPIVEVSTVAPQHHQESNAGYSAHSGHSFSVNSASSGYQQSDYASKSAGNGILLEEHVERVVIPKVVSSPSPVLSYEQQNVKSAVFGSTPKPQLFAAVTPATPAALERQEFIGPITLSSPAPFSLRKESLRQSIASTPSPDVFRGPEYLPPVGSGVAVQHNVHQYRQSVPAKFVESIVSTPSPVVVSKPSYSFRGRLDSKLSLAKQGHAVEEIQVLSTPTATVFKGPEYLPPVESGVSVQQNVKQFARPFKLTASTPSTPVFSNFKYSGVGQGQVHAGVAVQEIQVTSGQNAKFVPSVQTGAGLSVVQQSYQPIVETKFVSSTPSPAVFRRPEFVAVSSLQGESEGKSVQQNVETYAQGPVVEEVEVVQPVVSTPSPVFKRPQYFGFGTSQGHSQVKSVQQNVQTYSQVPVVEEIKVVQSAVSTPAPAVYNRQEYIAVGGVQDQKQQNIHTYTKGPVVEEVKVVQPVVSTPAPAVFRRPQYFGFGTSQGNTQVKSAVQTYSQVPVVEEVVQSVVSTPATIVYNQQENVQGQKSSVQQNIHTYSQSPVVEEVNIVQPVVSTQAPAVYKTQEFVTVDGAQGEKSSVLQNVQTHSQVPVVEEIKVVQPAVSTPAPAVFNRQEYISIGSVEGQKSGVQQNVQTYSKVPVVEEVSVVQPVVSTSAPAGYSRQEYIAVGAYQGQEGSFQQNVQTYSQVPVVEEINVVQPVVSTPAPAVIKEKYLSSGRSSVNIQQNVNKYRPTSQNQFPSTPAPTVYTKTEYVSSGVRADGGVTLLKPTVQTVYKGPEYLPPETDQKAELKSEVQGNVQTYSQPAIQEVNYVQPVVSTPAPSVVSVQNNYLQSAVLDDAKVRQQLIQSPIRVQSYNFVPSTTVTPIVYEQKQETVSISPVNVQQELYRSRPKSKQLFSSVVQSQVPVTYQRPQVQDVIYSQNLLKSPSPTPAQVFGYQSTSGSLSDVSLSTPKPTIYIEEVKNVGSVDETTPRPYVYEEYVEVSSPKPTESAVGLDETSVRVQQPIVVTEKPVIVQPKKESKTIYYEEYDSGNPVLTALEKEVVQPVARQEYFVSTESPIVVNNVEEIVDYLPPTGEEINNYANFEFQKVGKGRTGVFVQNGGARSQTYKVNSNIRIAPPPQEYILSATPKVVTSTVASTTAAPIETSTISRGRARPTTSTANYAYEDYEVSYGGNDEGKATIFTVGEVNKEELDDDNVESLLQKYSGDFGNVLGREKFVTKVVQGEGKGEFVLGNQEEASTIGYEVAKSRGGKSRYKNTEERTSEDATVASLDLKNLKIRKNKKTVIIVSQVSDANPLLIGKLAGQCSCQSNKLQIRKKVRVNGRTTTSSSTTYSPVDDDVTSESVLDSLAIEAITPKEENVVLIDGSRTAQGRNAFASRKSKTSGRSRFEVVTSQALLSPIPADEIAANHIDSTANAGTFDRYGPGGVRGIDETLQGSVDCERPGLFRHPKYCNKFYACNYDPWKKRYTLHIFNCPIHLSYDSSISACNWPSKGPACSDDHLLL